MKKLVIFSSFVNMWSTKSVVILLISSFSSLLAFSVQNNKYITPYLDNGTIARDTEFPWHVQVVPEGLPISYAGILISDQWVLTCAACANKAANYQLLFGYRNLSLAYEEEIGRNNLTVTGGAITLHPEFDPAQFNVNNVALINFPAITFSAYVTSVRLNNGTSDLLNVIARNPGFGSAPGDASKVLRYADMRIKALADCNGVDGQLCASPEVPNISPCTDEGSALTIPEIDTLPTAVGVLSYGYSSGSCPGPTALYMQMSKYVDWIQTTTGNAATISNGLSL